MDTVIIQLGLGTVIGFLSLVGLGVGGLYFALRGYDQYRLMADIVPTEIGNLEPGIAEVTGTVASAGETIRSPVADAECVAYSHTRREQSNDPDDTEVGRVLERLIGGKRTTRNKSVPFYVEDGSGRVLVDGAKADLALKKDESQTHEISSDQRVTDHERVLVEGDSVYVFGEVMEEPPKSDNAGGAFMDTVRARLEEAGEAVPLPLSRGEFVVSKGESAHRLFVSDGSERTGKRRQFLRVGMYGGGGALLLLVATFWVVTSVH